MRHIASRHLPWLSYVMIFLCVVAMGAQSARRHDLAKILADLREYDVPIPPQGTSLVICPSANDTEAPDGQLGFLIKPDADPATHYVLVGSNKFWVRDLEKVAPVSPDEVKLDRLYYDRGCGSFPSQLVTAVYCEAQGWHELARRLWQRAILENDKYPGGPKCGRLTLADCDDRAMAGTIAFGHYFDLLNRKEMDWRPTARSMIKIRQPTASGYQDDCLHSLALALKPSGAKPGSPESLIDGLIEATYFDDEPNRKLAQCGFEAIPALIDHALDDRWSRAHTFGALPTHRLGVGDLVKELLRGFVADDGAFHDLLDDNRQFDAAKARRWFEGARRTGEEPYLIGHAFFKASDVESESPSRPVFWAVAAKYPRRLPELYRELLLRPAQMDSFGYVQIIAESKMKKDEQVALFSFGCGQADFRHRVDALAMMQKLDHERFIGFLRRAMDEIPRTPAASYSDWPADELVALVAESKDLPAWERLLAAADRVDVGMKMELLESVGESGNQQGDDWLQFAIEMLGRSLDDLNVRDTQSDEKYNDVRAASSFGRLEVRNLAAMHLAKLFEWKDDPSPDWKDKQWIVLRAKVSAELKKRQQGK